MTLIKIDKADRDTLAKFCAECMIPCRFYTVESNDNLLQAEVDSDSPRILYGLGKMVGMAKIAEFTSKF
jgi:hypothetical protein